MYYNCPFYFFAREFVEDAGEFAGGARELVKVTIKLLFAAREFPDFFRKLIFLVPAFPEYIRRLVEYFLEFFFSGSGLENFPIRLTNVARELTDLAIRLTICSGEFGRGICQSYGSSNNCSEHIFKRAASYSQLLAGNNNYCLIN